MTASNAIHHIPASCSEHTRRPVTNPPLRGWEVHDAELPHPSTIMSRSSGVHWMCLPNGMEHLTIRELACLQSFPHGNEFSGNRADTWSQIGNAVPPMVGQEILEEVNRSLMRTDSNHPDGRSALRQPCFLLE